MRPWRSAGLIVALIASFALPAFMSASADVFLVSASDSIAGQLLDDHPGGLDVTLVAQGQLTPSGVVFLDAAVRNQLDRVGRLGQPRRIVYADLGLSRPAPDGESQPAPIIGSAARFLASDGAIDALDALEGDRSIDGVWISQWMSERLDLRPGVLVSIDDSAPVPIAGVFANLWEGERDPFWDTLPPAFVPRFSPVLAGPLFETMILPESLFLDLGGVGFVRWDARAVSQPGSYRELVEQSTRTRRIERSTTESSEMVAALAVFAGPGGPAPVLSSDVFDLRDETERIAAELDEPIAIASVGGTVLGLLVTAAGAVFVVRKRETEVRLLRGDGDPAWRFAARALAQFVAPAALGAAIGVGAAWFLIGAPGDGARPDADVIDVGSIVVVAVIGLGVAAVITGAASSRALHTRRSGAGALRMAWFLPIIGIAAAAWIQVGRAADSAEVDPLVIAFPLVGLIAGVGVIVLAVRWLMHRAHRGGGSLPPALFLAWRRISSADVGAVLLATALGISLGLIVFSSALVAALDRATEAKATTAVGGATQVWVEGRFDADLPPETTLVQVLTTRLTIGNRSVTVLAIDPSTYPRGVSWHPAFGASAAELVELLDQPVDGEVAAVAAGRRSVPQEAGFGTTTVLSYAVVDTIEAVPLTSEVSATLVVSAPAVDAAARRNHEAQRPPDVDATEWADEFRSPLQRARPVLISQLDDATLTSFLADGGARIRELVTLADRRNLVGSRAARWTFEYISLLAVMAGLAAVGALFFYLSEQRANRQLSAVMVERMGLGRRAGAVAAVVEVLGLVVVAFVAGTSVGLVVAARVFDRFEPERRLPPDVGLQTPWPLVGAIAVAATVVVILAALGNHWLAGRRSYAEVLRGS